MTDLNRLSALSATELTALLETPDSVLVGISGGEWYAVVQLLTQRLTWEGGSLSGEELNRGAAALDIALGQAERAGGIGQNERAIRRLNLTSALLRIRGQSPDVVLLSPQRMYDLFSEAVPFSPAQIRAFPVDWRTLDITVIRRLRLVKNLVTPLLGVRSILEEAGFVDEMSEWSEILPRLP